jgi:hypothetical protein
LRFNYNYYMYTSSQGDLNNRLHLIHEDVCFRLLTSTS